MPSRRKRDPLMTEYGLTDAEADRVVARLLAESDREAKAGELVSLEEFLERHRLQRQALKSSDAVLSAYDKEELRVATERLRGVQSGKSRTYSADEVKRDLGMLPRRRTKRRSKAKP